MTRLRIALGAGVIVAILGAFLAGRYSSRPRVEVRTVVDESAVSRAVELARAEWTRDAEDHTVTRTIYREGRPVERIVYVDREVHSGGTSTTSATTSTATASTSSSAVVPVAPPPGWRAGLAASWDPRALRARPGLWGAEVDRRIVGGLWVGARADSDRRAGLALSLEW